MVVYNHNLSLVPSYHLGLAGYKNKRRNQKSEDKGWNHKYFRNNVRKPGMSLIYANMKR